MAKNVAGTFSGMLQKRVSKIIAPKLKAVLQDVAKFIVNEIDTFTSGPTRATYNLRDATGVGVYVDGVLSAYAPSKKATRTQSTGFGYTNTYNIDGSLELQEALQQGAQGDFRQGIWIVVFSSVRYAYYLTTLSDAAGYHGSLKDYFKQLSEGVLSKVVGSVKTVFPDAKGGYPKM